MNQNDKINTASKRSKLAQNQGHLYRCVCACVCLCVRLWYIKKQWYTLLVTCGNECKWVDHDLSKFLYAGTAIVSNGQRSTKHCMRKTIFKEHPFSTVCSRYKPLLHDTSCRACFAVIWIYRRKSVTNQLVDTSCKNLISSMKLFWCLNRTKSLQDPSNLSDSRLNNPNDSIVNQSPPDFKDLEIHERWTFTTNPCLCPCSKGLRLETARSLWNCSL